MLFRWKDGASWRPLLEKTQGRRQTRTSILDAFRHLYRGIEVYHGCRPVDVSDYYRQGLRLGDRQALTQMARTVFLSGEFPEIDEARFEVALKRLSGIDNGVAFVMLDDRYLLQRCGHYLIYGSEHMCGIAAQL